MLTEGKMEDYQRKSCYIDQREALLEDQGKMVEPY